MNLTCFQKHQRVRSKIIRLGLGSNDSAVQREQVELGRNWWQREVVKLKNEAPAVRMESR